jgi:hypothetical protein
MDDIQRCWSEAAGSSTLYYEHQLPSADTHFWGQVQCLRTRRCFSFSNLLRFVYFAQISHRLFDIFRFFRKCNYMEQSLSWEARSLSTSQAAPAFYGARLFITVHTRARHRSLPQARWIQSTLPHVLPLRSALILSSYLMFSHQNIVFMSLLSLMYYMPCPSYPFSRFYYRFVTSFLSGLLYRNLLKCEHQCQRK